MSHPKQEIVSVWFSLKHAEHLAGMLDGGGSCQSVLIDGVRHYYTALNDPDAKEAFTGCGRNFPDYVRLGTADLYESYEQHGSWKDNIRRVREGGHVVA